MALTTYLELKAALADQLARDDLTSQIPDFITLFECEAARELFRQRGAETSTDLTMVSGEADLPSDYMGWRGAVWSGSTPQTLEYVHPNLFTSYYPTAATGVPQVFTVTGSTIKVAPVDDTETIAFDYFAKLGALSSSLNWLMTNHPDVYFFGSLEQAYLYCKDPESAVPWNLKKTSVYDGIKKQRFREDGSLTIRVQGQTP